MENVSDPWELRVRIVRKHFEAKGYRVHSGLQFGCELVLYADDPSRVHSDFCVHVVREGMYIHYCICYVLLVVIYSVAISLTHLLLPSLRMLSLPFISIDGHLDWRQMQSLVRSMPDLHKTLILAQVRLIGDDEFVVEELAMATEHAPFRHKKREPAVVGGQQKKIKTTESVASENHVVEEPAAASEDRTFEEPCSSI